MLVDIIKCLFISNYINWNVDISRGVISFFLLLLFFYKYSVIIGIREKFLKFLTPCLYRDVRGQGKLDKIRK